MTNATVIEKNSRVEGTGTIVEREGSITTNAKREFFDLVGRGTNTDTEAFKESAATIEELKFDINTTDIHRVTEQTLTVKSGDERYEIIYRRTVSNRGPDGKFNKTLNENGVNVVVSHTTPTIKRLP